jgi:bis(5'-nucleosyl)-tetraphosphatase (symmetrical)
MPQQWRPGANLRAVIARPERSPQLSDEPMNTYVIGDIHGAYRTLQSLLEELDLSPHDRVWLVGDLVNNGPDSAEVIRWAMRRGERLTCVLGNHDLHMLAVWSGSKERRSKDTFQDVLDAPDADVLCEWMLHRPMLHIDGQDVMVHAGLLPEWDLDRARKLATQLEDALRQTDPTIFFNTMYGNEPAKWSEDLSYTEQLRITVNAMTRMRALTRDRVMEFKYKATLAQMPDTLLPWFEHDHRLGDARLFFGHWSAVGYHRHGNIHALDSGVTWGNQLTAFRLEDGAMFSVDCVPGDQAPSARPLSIKR